MNMETFHKQYALALQALGIHMEMHDLPAPAAVDTIVDYGFGPSPQRQVIRLRLPALPDEQTAWINSVAIDDEDIVEVEHGFRSTWSVRLPDTGFRFELVGLRPRPIHMVVPA